ncbi:ral guanine nucleotide dissociation stimulator-like 1 [Leucoraja erinacea]|uniref:ral guanine nucleotide dissociation stimulator-like 1 n=1 Tax=Leucoraja erinaceus TaxID=7782 RepID=UPI002456FE61|nr:ral guanine nucleotide dissociation stimulator-like 1 [Leucoraja erinacea]
MVVPDDCLGGVWSKRDKKGNEHLAPTVRATITQFNTVTNCVVGTILRDLQLKPQQRGKIMEKWIDIAEECRMMRNFSSLQAIVSALQSISIYRLKRTWDTVSKDCMLMFEELSQIFSYENNKVRSRELLKKGVMQGTVPFLGTFLTDLMMLDTAFPDYVDGLTNLVKRQREFEVLSQIKLLQSSCNIYCISPVESFLQWFRGQQHLTEDESYNISLEMEPRIDKSLTSAKPRKSTVKHHSLTPTCLRTVPTADCSGPTSTKPRKSMMKRLSLLFLGSEVNRSSTPKNSDQPKSPPSNSSGENMNSISFCSSNHNIKATCTTTTDTATNMPADMPADTATNMPADTATNMPADMPAAPTRPIR